MQSESLHCSLSPSSAPGARGGRPTVLPRAQRARSGSVCLISGESEAQCWAGLLQATSTGRIPVSVLAVVCPSVSLILPLCCVLASSHSGQRLLDPEKQERPTCQNSSPFSCLSPFPYSLPIRLTAHILFCSFQKRGIPVPCKHLFFCLINKTITPVLLIIKDTSVQSPQAPYKMAQVPVSPPPHIFQIC